MRKYSGLGDSNCLSVAKIGLKIYSYSTILFVSCMEQLYIEALLIHWHTGLKFSSENRNPQIPKIGRKNRPIHPLLKVKTGFIKALAPKVCMEKNSTCVCGQDRQMSRVMRKPTFWFPTWSDTNQAIQLQKMARGLKFRI